MTKKSFGTAHACSALIAKSAEIEKRLMILCRTCLDDKVQEMSSRLSAAEWEQIKTAYASGLGLRELARNACIPAGTVLARAQRQGWTQQIAQAKLIQRPGLARELAKPDAIGAITPWQSAAITLQQRAERYSERMAGISETILPHLEAMDAADILEHAPKVEMTDRWSRRNFGLDDRSPSGGILNLAVLTNQAAIQISAVGK